MLEPELRGWAGRVRPLALVFVLLALPVLLMLVVLIPPGYSPDEPDHAARAESLLHGAVLGMRDAGVGMDGARGVVTGVWANPGIAVADRGILPGAAKVMTRADLERLLAVPWSGAAAFVQSSVAPYFPVFYVPQAAGMGLARLAGGAPLVAIYAGRLAAALAYALLGMLALTLAARGAGLLFATLMLPMTLWLAASLNQDGLMIAAACVAAALLTRVDNAGGRARIGAAVGLALIVLAKPPYAPLAALLLLPIRGVSGRAIAGRVLLMVLTVLPAVVWSGLLVRYVSASVPMVPYAAGPLYGGAAGTMFEGTDLVAQLHVLLDPATRLLSVPVVSMVMQAPSRLRQMVGVLGLLDLGLPGPFYLAWLLALAGALLAVPFGAGRARLVDWVGCGLTVLAVFGGLMLVYVTLYLSWTRVGLDRVEGVQGRYFLPLLPFLIFGLPPMGPRPAFAGVLAVPAVVLGAVGLVALPLLTVGWFYLR